MVANSISRGTLRPWQWVAVGGFVAGILDIVYATTFWGLQGVAPARILQSIAAGVQGNEAAMAGGNQSAALGLLLHFMMALMMSSAYFLASRWQPALVRRPALFGTLYGLLLYVVMNYVVVPLSAAGPGQSPSGLWMWGSIFAHVLLVGIPCAYAARSAHHATMRMS